MADESGSGEERLSVVDRPLGDEMKQSYMQYAMSVIKSRALPDARDGLKPSQRRVLYTMANDLNLMPNRQRLKSARVVGDTMGRYHPHGDSAIYGTLVRLAQNFASRYLLVDPKGNFGSISGASPAAMRYTECRMAPAAVDMVADIDLGTVEMVENYDQTLSEPLVLPARFPNLLCNGSQGIAVGMATSIPPHNLGEVATALTALAQDPGLSDRKILEMIPGPDFPTGGIICGTQGIKQAYLTGQGRVTVRGRVETDVKNDKATITITELPYQVSTENLKEKIQEAYKGGKIDGITALRDQSKGAVKVVVDCRKGEDPEVILNQLYKFTPLQSTFSIIMIALDERGTKPRTFTLRELLEAFIEHRYEVIRRRTEFLLRRCRARIHILRGLRAALDQIDAVIQTIRSSQSTDEARTRLIELLAFVDGEGNERQLTTRQANAILDMRLQRLTALEQEKLTGELEEELKKEADFLDILRRKERVVEIFVDETNDVRTRLGKNSHGKPEAKKADERLTTIEQSEVGDIDIEDLIADETAVVTVTHQGYIKRTSLDAYRLQARAGKGLYGASTRDDDFVSYMFQASTKDTVLCFTSHGRVHWLKVYQIPEGSRTARGRGLRNVVALLPDEVVQSLIPIKGDFAEDRFLLMATALGVVKKTKLSAFARPKKGGIVAVKLDEEDHLIGVRVTDGEREVMLASRHGKAIRFSEDTVRAMGRAARGVKGMTLEEGDEVVSLSVVGEDGPTLLTVSELGYGKRTPVEDYRETNRAGKGIRSLKITSRNGKVIGALTVGDTDQVMLITSSGKLIRMRATDISTIGRDTQGVRLIRVADGEKVVAIARVESDEEDHEEEPTKPVES